MNSMFATAASFNQDLSSWEVCNVVTASNFRVNTPSWTEPKPKVLHPCILEVNSPNNNSRIIFGEPLKIHVKFHRDVVVTGTPKLELQFNNGIKKNASYKNGSNTQTLIFEYEITKEDYSFQVDYTGKNALNFGWWIDKFKRRIPSPIRTSRRRKHSFCSKNNCLAR